MHKRSFGWIARKIHNKIKYLKVLTYDGGLSIIFFRSFEINFDLWIAMNYQAIFGVLQ
jgi:hypothetical protein